MTDEAALLEVDVQLKFADYVRYQYYDSLRRTWWLIPLFLFASGFSAIVVVVSAVYQDSYLLRDIIPFFCMVLLGGILLSASPYLTAQRDFSVKAGLRQVIRYRIHEDYLAIISSKLQGRLSWKKVREARETGTAFFLYVQGSQAAFILPKHEFAEGEVAALRELLSVILGARKCRFKLGRVESIF